MKTYYRKTVILLICVIIICAAIGAFFYSSKNGEIEVGLPEITVLETASNVSINPNTYNPESFFTRGEKIWIYVEYTNVSHNGECDFYISLSVNHLNGDRLGFVQDHVTKNEKACFYYFNTNESWPAGLYFVSSNLIDNISEKTAVKSTDFDLI